MQNVLSDSKASEQSQILFILYHMFTTFLLVQLPLYLQIVFVITYISFVTFQSEQEVGLVLIVLFVSSYLFGGLYRSYMNGLFVFAALLGIQWLRRKKCVQFVYIVMSFSVIFYLLCSYRFEVSIVPKCIIAIILCKDLVGYVEDDRSTFLKVTQVFLYLSMLYCLKNMHLITNQTCLLCMIYIVLCLWKWKQALVFVIYMLLFVMNVNMMMVVGGIVLALFRNDRFMFVWSYLFVLFMIPFTLYNVAMFSGFALCLLYSNMFLLEQSYSGLEECSNQGSIAILQAYVEIFKLLANYYDDVQNVFANLLFQLSWVIEKQVQNLQQEKSQKELVQEVEQYLKCYGYHIYSSQYKNKCLCMQLRLSQKSEVKQVVMPLVEQVFHKSFDLVNMQRVRFHHQIYLLALKEKQELKIITTCGSMKNAYTSNGDSYRIFRYHQDVVCMISDGMGNGEEAFYSSQLVSDLFENMIRSGMQVETVIPCINNLVQSDTFATLDVLYFHQAQQQVYISKSAACPTYMIRGGNVEEIQGHALPIGIVNQVHPDCFRVKYQAQDVFLMVSDGILKSEIEKWVLHEQFKDVKNRGKLLCEVLNERIRFDDSTFILVQIAS